MEKQLRCKDCKWVARTFPNAKCWRIGYSRKRVNPGQFACKKFVYKDK